MLDPRSLKSRTGRIRRNAGAYPLPTIWVETGEPFTRYADHALWRLPNTYPFLPLDNRVRYFPDPENSYGFEFFDETPIPPDVFADNVQNRIELYHQEFGPVFRAIGKPFRYAFILGAVDAVHNDYPLRLTKDRRDVYFRGRQRPWMLPSERTQARSRSCMRRNRTCQGLTGRLGSDYLNTPFASSFFHIEGRKRTRAWSIAAFSAARERLDTLGLPIPELLVTDVESNAKEYKFGYSVNPNIEPLVAPLANGWFERLERQLALQPRLHDFVIDGGRTLKEWLSENYTTLAGTQLDEHDLQYYVSHPHENDRLWRMVAANEMAYIRSLIYGLFEPAKSAFGEQLQCGEWAYFADSRQYPSEVRPSLYRYWKSGHFGTDLQIPANYPVGASFDETRPAGDTDSRWSFPANWSSRLQLAGTSTNQLNHKVVLELMSGLDRSAAQSGSARLMPSTGINQLLVEGTYDVGRDFVLERVARAVTMGAQDIWFFVSGFNHPTAASGQPPTFADILRSTVPSFLTQVNARFSSSVARRNGRHRNRTVSNPLLM